MAKRTTITQVMVKELEVEYERPPFGTMVHITDSKGCHQLFRKVFKPKTLDHKEVFWVAVLNRANLVLGVSRIGVGTVSGCTVNIKEIFQIAILSNASSIVLCHNHPSGNLKPSHGDVTITEQIKKGCVLLDLVLLDHIILTSEGYLSFVDEGLM